VKVIWSAPVAPTFSVTFTTAGADDEGAAGGVDVEQPARVRRAAAMMVSFMTGRRS
jgi:hypothetical protein